MSNLVTINRNINESDQKTIDKMSKILLEDAMAAAGSAKMAYNTAIKTVRDIETAITDNDIVALKRLTSPSIGASSPGNADLYQKFNDVVLRAEFKESSEEQ